MAEELTLPPHGYAEFLTDLKRRIQTAQVRAALSVNRELVLLCWQIGRDIIARQRDQGWGAKVVERLSRDLRAAFPEMKGFSPRNLVYIQTLAKAYPDEAFVQGPLAQITWRDIKKPLGIAEYRLQEALPGTLQGSLPTIAALEAELERLAAVEQ